MGRSLDFKKNAKVVTQVMKNSTEDLNNKKRDIDVSLIDMNPDNEEIFGLEDVDFMSETIKEDGFSGAIEVYALDNGRYEISSGHRRYLAAKEVGMETIPAIVSEQVDDKTKAKKLIKSNILNRKMTPLKTARALAYYREKVLYDFPHEKTKELARVFNLPHTNVKRYLSLLKLAPELQKYADNDDVPYTNLVLLTKLDEEEQITVYNRMKAYYGNPENVFLVANGTYIEQKVNEILQENVKTPLPTPTVEQVKNRVEKANEEEESVPVPAVVEDRREDDEDNSFSYEDAMMDSFNEQMEEARVIDAQLTVIMKNLLNLVSSDFIVSDSVKEKVIEQMNEIVDKLNK